MYDRDESRRKYESFLQDIESHLERIFAAKNDEVVRSLEERIKALRAEAEAKAAQHLEEIARAKQDAERHAAAARELEERGEAINARINELFTRTDAHKQDILRLTEAAAQDLAAAQELDAQRGQIQREADARVQAMKELIVDRNRIEAAIPEFDLFQERKRAEIAREMNRWNAVRSLLVAAEPEPPPAPEA